LESPTTAVQVHTMVHFESVLTEFSEIYWRIHQPFCLIPLRHDVKAKCGNLYSEFVHCD